MTIIFAGVGEALDEQHGNTSLIVLPAGPRTSPQILLDCGFTAAHSFWSHSPDPTRLDTVWISHFHGDHFLGLPLLFLRLSVEGRTEPLLLVGPAGIEEKAMAALDLAYPGFHSQLGFEIRTLEVSPGEHLERSGVRWSFAPSDHSQPCLALRLDGEAGSLFYSGDGTPTDESLALARDCHLLVHEAFGWKEAKFGHGDVDRALDFARRARARAIALVHMNRNVRLERGEELKEMLATIEDLRALLPEAGDRIGVGSPSPRPEAEP